MVSLIFLSVPVICYVIDADYRKTSEQIKNDFLWCQSKKYMSFKKDTKLIEIEDKEIDFNYDLAKAIYQNDKNVYSVSFHNSLLYVGNYFYFCVEEKMNNQKKTRLTIYKTDFDISFIERIIIIGESERNMYSFDSAFGFDKKGYFRIDDRYFDYNFVNNELVEINNSDDRINLSVFDNYLKNLHISKEKCKYKKDVVTYEYGQVTYSFNLNILESEKLKLIKKYGFVPEWCLSFDEGLTSIVHYGSSRFLGYGDCFILTYDRNTNQIVDYQLLFKTYFHEKDTILFPQIVIL